MDPIRAGGLLVDFHQFPLIPLFEEVDEDLVVSWMVHRPQRGLQAGEQLIQRDRLAEQAFLLLEGELMVHLDPSPSYALGSVSPGECVGEVSTLCGIPATANVSAAADSVVCEVPRDELIAWARQSHQFALNLITLMGRRLRTSNLLLSDEQHSRERLQTRSVTDALTGVLHRGWIKDEHEAFQQLFSHGSVQLSVLMIDIDHFKTLNDTLGHAAGDEALRAVAQFLSSQVRDSDVLMRWGGEEFLVICTSVGAEDKVCALAQRLCDGLAAQPMQLVGQAEPVFVTVSIGVAHRRPAELWDALVQRADQALYAAKAAGRARVVEAAPSASQA